MLAQLGLPANLSLSVLAVELLPGGVGSDLPNPFIPRIQQDAAASTQNPDPLSLDGRPRRILRASPLVQVAAVC